MKQFFLFIPVSIFSIFIGAQITEGVLLVPYWQSLSATHFYSYYHQFGPSIGQFYTPLTILAALMPIATLIYCKSLKDSNAPKFALISVLFAALFASSFYLYFKDTNQLFYQAALSEVELKNELIIWGYWHWARIITESLSLFFLMLALNKIQHHRNSSF